MNNDLILEKLFEEWVKVNNQIAKIESKATKRAVDGDLVRTLKANFFERASSILQQIGES